MPTLSTSEISPPLWRSMLFIPAHVDKFVDKAHTRGADAIILDLEDSVPETEKEHARDNLLTAAIKVSTNGADVLVRINSRLRLAIRDLEAAVHPSIRAIVIPKVVSDQQLKEVSEVIAELEIERSMKVGEIGLVALVESPDALSRLAQIANSCPRLLAMTIGSEDFSTATGMIPSAENLLLPNQQLLFACRAAGRLPLGFVGSIADYSDPLAFEQTITRAKNMGFRGAFCIHPSQVPIMNEGYSPTELQVNDAREVVNAYQEALKLGRGAAKFNGKMVDVPVVLRAEEILRTTELIAHRNSRTI
ncbi:MAG: citrate lyase subunit beta/citryl-CoA lyase [Oceanicoccus sp.]